MAFWEDEVVAVEVWYYIHRNAPAEWLFLFVLEEKIPIGAGPGIRLALVDEELTVEHKFPNPNIYQNDATAIKFPRDEWVKVNFEALLSKKEDGYIKVWQNDVLIIEQMDWQTLPKDILYFNLGTKAMYNQIEFGATANGSDSPVTVNVDDVRVEVLP